MLQEVHPLYAMQVKSFIKVPFLLVIGKTYFFPKQNLSLSPATRFVQVCEVSVPQKSFMEQFLLAPRYSVLVLSPTFVFFLSRWSCEEVSLQLKVCKQLLEQQLQALVWFIEVRLNQLWALLSWTHPSSLS